MDGEAEDEEEEDEMEVGKVNLIPVLCLFELYCYSELHLEKRPKLQHPHRFLTLR